ncbi:hypothetical protein LR48_Vigan05g121900 [Vigna angularis]|uniref:Uncharacterized protein n=1 Tax=Phaseolus angularis TaxID=3914 RepID=A0A0L9UM45_PHAAN|nr:hypothetical protein LR48_Vigan05g121900 [Vigna angularis]
MHPSSPDSENLIFSSFSLNLLHLLSKKSSLFLLRSLFRHRRSTSGVKSFQINRLVCEAELLENCRALRVEELVVVKRYSV